MLNLASIHTAAVELESCLLNEQTVVISAPPGSGKTTRLPFSVLSALGSSGGLVIVLEPRRIAAVSAASFMASQRQERVGGTVGYAVRFSSAISADTRIMVVTEGVLIRRLQQDPLLDGVVAVVFDEFHERSVDTDLCFALCREIQSTLRPDLRLIIMSATLEGIRSEPYLNQCRHISCGEQPFPVQISYENHSVARTPLAILIATTITKVLKETDGDLLVFLPGISEIRAVERALKVPNDTEVYQLYGGMTLEQQQLAVQAGTKRKIILSTAVAESSITIESVRVVIDSGLARHSRLDPTSGLERLVTVRVSRSSAVQRAGRAGRTAPGRCYRVYTEQTFHGLTTQAPPEILRADLSHLVLEVAAWGGTRCVKALPWLTPPPEQHYSVAEQLLTTLGALTKEGLLTEIGRSMATLALHPRLARVLIEAREYDVVAATCVMLAAITPEGRFGDRRAIARQLAVRMGLSVQALPAAAFPQDLPAACLLVGWPDRIARRHTGVGTYQLVSGAYVTVRFPESVLLPEWIVALQIEGTSMRGGVISDYVTIDETVVRTLCRDQIVKERQLGWSPDGQRIIASDIERLGNIVLQDRAVAVKPDETIPFWRAHIVDTAGDTLCFSGPAERLRDRCRFLRSTCREQLIPTFSADEMVGSLWPELSRYVKKCKTITELKSLNLYPVMQSALDYTVRCRIDHDAPEHCAIPSGRSVMIQYPEGEQPYIAVKLQELFGCIALPMLAGGKVALQARLLSPAGRVIAVTDNLSRFWREGYYDVRRELRGRYPKHPWPEDPFSIPATRSTTKRLRHQ